MGKAEKQKRNKERKISEKKNFQDYQFEEDKNYLVRGFMIPGKVLKNMQEQTHETYIQRP